MCKNESEGNEIMRKTKIITDSCADIGGDLLEKYDIDYAKMTKSEDGVETDALLTWSDEDAHELYETLRAGKRILTAQVSVEEFNRIFTKYLDAGYDIVYIACSSKQSGSVNTGHITARKLLAKYPDAAIYCVDSLNASCGEGLLAVECAKLARMGKSAEEINKYALSIRKNINEFATVHTLDHLKRAGRVKASAAFFGNLMGVKPILISDVVGDQTAIKKVRGRQKSLEEIVSCMKEAITDSEKQTIYLAHADCSQEEIETVISLIKEKIPCCDIHIGYIGPIIGASVGPDAMALWAIGQAVTYKAEEK